MASPPRALSCIASRARQLVDNAGALVDAIMRAKPATAKGKYLMSAHVSSTMGPSVKLDEAELGRLEA